MPEQRHLDRDERKLSADLAGLHGQRNDRADWFTSHPEAACRLDGIESEIETLNVAARSGAAVNLGRDAWRDWPWLRDTPARDRGLDMGLGR
jgi:hypothetical protein